MTYTIIRRVPHTSKIVRSAAAYKTRQSAISMMEILNIMFSNSAIRHVERF